MEVNHRKALFEIGEKIDVIIEEKGSLTPEQKKDFRDRIAEHVNISSSIEDVVKQGVVNDDNDGYTTPQRYFFERIFDHCNF